MVVNLILGVFFALFILISLKVEFTSGQRGVGNRTRDELVTDVYHGCGFDKYCLKICHLTQPSCRKCISEYNCPAMVSVEFRFGKYYSQMIIQKLGFSPEFIAMGLSDDANMGNDAVVVCVIMNGAQGIWNMFGAWTTGLKTVDYDVNTIPYYDLTHTYIDGTYVCSFQWKKVFVMKGKTFNVSFDSYYLLASRGEAGSPWVINGHQRSEVSRVVAGQNVTLLSVPELEDYDEMFEDKGVCHNISILLIILCLAIHVAVSKLGQQM